MSHVLPAANSPLRDMFDVADLAAIGTGERPVHCNIWELRRVALDMFAAIPAAKRAYYFRVNPSNDQLELVSFGRRGGWKRHWVFGPITRATRLA